MNLAEDPFMVHFMRATMDGCAYFMRGHPLSRPTIAHYFYFSIVLRITFISCAPSPDFVAFLPPALRMFFSRAYVAALIDACMPKLMPSSHASFAVGMPSTPRYA